MFQVITVQSLSFLLYEYWYRIPLHVMYAHRQWCAAQRLADVRKGLRSARHRQVFVTVFVKDRKLHAVWHWQYITPFNTLAKNKCINVLEVIHLLYFY